MPVIYLLGNSDHAGEHFKVDSVPNRVLIQTSESSYFVFQHNGKMDSGNYEFRFVRSQKGQLDGLFEIETETSADWGSMYS